MTGAGASSVPLVAQRPGVDGVRVPADQICTKHET